MNAANYFTKIQPQIGKWSTKSLWETLSRAKKAIGDACGRVTGRVSADKSCEELVAASCDVGRACRPSLLRQFTYMRGVVQSQQQIYAKQVGWCRGGSQFFGRNYLWRRMKTAHLIGFASLFLASEERAAEDSAYKIKLQEYEAMFHHIQDMFTQNRNDCGKYLKNQDLGDSLSDYEMGKCIETGCNGSVYEAEAIPDDAIGDNVAPLNSQDILHSDHHTMLRLHKRESTPLAIKMIFNFNSSDGSCVWRDTKAEMVTCGRGALNGLKNWQNGSRFRMKRLPFHPNIIQIKKAIFQKVPDHKEFIKQHPAALPRPNGFGRSSAMFLVMKRYNSTLSDILRNHDLTYTSLQILALQLLNGVAHLERNHVAHRDLKANNILIETDANGIPRLTITDFGCAFVADCDQDLIISEKFDLRNGSAFIQPPEIKNCVPSPNYVLDYRKSDAWAAGLLLCEIFGVERAELKDVILHDKSEKAFICGLIKLLLKEDSRQRISCIEASKVLHLHLFGPEFSQGENVEIAATQWILMHAAETVAYESTQWGKDSVVCELFMNFLSHISLDSLCTSLGLWQSLSLHPH